MAFRNLWTKIVRLVQMKAKFALSSSVATALDYGVYVVLTEGLGWYAPFANVLSQSLGMVANFFLQKRFVFNLKRKLGSAFLISFLSSLVGLGLGTFLIYILDKIAFFHQHQYVLKALVTGIIFFYNFYMKRFAFEKRWT